MLQRNATHVLEHIELPAKLLDYFLRNNKSNINQIARDMCFHMSRENRGLVKTQNRGLVKTHVSRLVKTAVS